MPLTLTLERQKQVSSKLLWLVIARCSNSTFQGTQGYVEKLCLRQSNTICSCFSSCHLPTLLSSLFLPTSVLSVKTFYEKKWCSSSVNERIPIPIMIKMKLASYRWKSGEKIPWYQNTELWARSSQGCNLSQQQSFVKHMCFPRSTSFEAGKIVESKWGMAKWEAKKSQ